MDVDYLWVSELRLYCRLVIVDSGFYVPAFLHSELLMSYIKSDL